VGVAVLLTSGLQTGPAVADDIGGVGRIAQIGDPAGASDPVVPGLGNVADVLDGPPPQRPRPEQRPEQRPQEQRAHEMSEGGPTQRSGDPAEDPDGGPVDADNAPAAPGDGTPVGPGPQAPEAPGPQGPQGQQAPAGPNAPDRAQLESQLLSATNQARAANGCAALLPDWHLAMSAQQHSDDMAAHSYFSHSSLDGQTFDQRIHNTGFNGQTVGENIASGFNSAPEVESAWMDSPAHRRNILDCGFRSIGIGYDQQGGYWTVDFGS
jgi:uncharacterized protein YkwD